MTEPNEFWGNMGAGILVISYDKKFLIAKRSRYVEEPGTWGNIGGAMDIDSTQLKDIEAEALREFFEETRHELKNRLIPAYVFKKHHFRYYIFLAVSKEFEAIPDWETEEFRWVSFEELSSYNLHFGLKALLENSVDLINQILTKLD